MKETGFKNAKAVIVIGTVLFVGIFIGFFGGRFFVGKSTDISSDNKEESIEISTASDELESMYNNVITFPVPDASTIETTQETTTKELTTISREERIRNIQSVIRVLEVRYNSSDGKWYWPEIFWRNESDKTIKYIDFWFQPYNAVDDPVRCSISGHSEQECSITGPIEKTNVGTYFELKEYSGYSSERGAWTPVTFQEGDPYAMPLIPTDNYIYLSPEDIERTAIFYRWENVWKNSDIRRIELNAIRIRYMDGSTFYISPSEIGYVWW